MAARGKQVVEKLVPIHPRDVVLAQLGALYRERVWCLLGEIGERLEAQRATLSELRYRHHQETTAALTDWWLEGARSLGELELLLKCALVQLDALTSPELPLEVFGEVLGEVLGLE